VHDLVGFENAQVGTVQQDAGKQGRSRAGRFAVGVGQPGVHGGQPHFGAVAHQDEHKAGLEPHGIQLFGHIGQAENETGASTLPTSMDKVTSTEPKRAMAMPTEQISTYFQVASREAADRWV
jgi:hypothetical protein